MSKPQRIASLLSSATEMLFGIGVGDRVAAVSHECDFPPEIAGLPRVTVSHVDSMQSSQQIDDQVQERMTAGKPLYDIDREALRKLKPDLIVTQAQCDVCAVRYEDVIDFVESENDLRTARVVALNPLSLEEIFADIQRIGAAVGELVAAHNYVTKLRERVAAVDKKTAAVPVENRPRVACIEWIEPLMLAANWMPRVIELAGGQNGLTEGERHSTYSNWQDVIDYDPEVIVIMPCGFDLPRSLEETQTLQQLPGWTEISAVKNRRAFAADGNAYFNRSGPRIVASLEILAHLFHPHAFAQPGIEGEGFQRLG